MRGMSGPLMATNTNAGRNMPTVAAAFFLIRYKVNSAWLVLGGAAVGAGKVLLG